MASIVAISVATDPQPPLFSTFKIRLGQVRLFAPEAILRIRLRQSYC